MNCKIDYDILNDFAEGNLDELSSLIIDEHRKTCTRCSDIIEEIETLNGFLNDVEKEEIVLPEELKKIKINILSKLKTDKSVLFNIRLLKSKIKLGSEKMNNYINSYPGVKTGRKMSSLVTNEVLKGMSYLSTKAVKNGYRALLNKRYV